MTSVMITVDHERMTAVNHRFVEMLKLELDVMVADAISEVDPEQEISNGSILVDHAYFGSDAVNNPDVWVVISIAKNELYTNAKQPIRTMLINTIIGVCGETGVALPNDWSVDVVLVDGTGSRLNSDGMVVANW